MFYPTPKELEILKALKKYHYMTVDQVALATGLADSNAARKLKRLAPAETPENKNAIRYAWEIRRPTTVYGVPQKRIYCLSNLGKTYLEQWTTEVLLPSKKIDSNHIDHFLAINDILIRIEVFCRNHPDKWELIHLEHDRDLHARQLSLPVIPDGFFEVAFLPTKNSFPTLLEMDMGSEKRTTHWAPKINGYLDILGKKCEEAFGFRHPTILTVTLTEKRMKELKRWTEEIVYKRDWEYIEQLFYFTWFETTIDKYSHIKGMSADELLFTPRYLVGGSDDPVYLFSR